MGTDDRKDLSEFDRWLGAPQSPPPQTPEQQPPPPAAPSRPLQRPPTQGGYYGYMPSQQQPHPAYQSQYVYPPQRVKKPMSAGNVVLITLGTIVGSIILLCVVLGALVSHAPTTSSPSTTSGGSPSFFSTAVPTATPSPSKVGDAITVEDVSVTVTSAQVIPGDDFAKPKPGYEFVLVHVTIANQSTSEIDYNPFDFHSWDGNGNIGDHEIFFPDSYTADNELHSGSLTPGGHREGDLLFQFPQGDHQAKVTWVYGFLSTDTQNAWLLGL